MKGDEENIKKAAKQVGAQAQEDVTKEYKNIAEQASKGGMLPQEALGLSDTMVEGIYGQAYRLYNSGRYKDASQLFRLLLMLNATEAKYVMGLAACFHMEKEYASAAETYSLCGIFDPDSPVPYFHASDCYIQMGDRMSAIISLEMAVKRAGDKPEFAMLKDRALLTIESLKKDLDKAEKAKKTGKKGSK